MQLKLRFGIVLSLAVVVCASVVAWKFIASYRHQQKQFAKNVVERQLSAVRQLGEVRNQQTRREMEDLFVGEATQRVRQSRMDRSAPMTDRLQKSPFLALAFLTLNAQQWEAKWIAANAQVLAWPADYFTQLLPTLPLARAQNGEMDWSRITTPGSLPALAVVSAVDVKIGDKFEAGLILGVLPVQYLAGLGDGFSGEDQELFVVDDKGHALVIPEQKYLGAKIDQHGLIAHVLKTQSFKGFGDYINLSGEGVVGAYEKMAKSNLTVAVAQPMPRALALVGPFLWEVGLLALALLGIFGVILYFVGRPFFNGYEFMYSSIIALATRQPLRQPEQCPEDFVDLKRALDFIQTGNPEVLAPKPADTPAPAPAPAPAAPTVARSAEPEAHPAIFKQIGQGLSQSLKGPLAAILGHTQLARAKAKDEDLKQHFVVIEREARHAREVIENLSRIAGANQPEVRRIDLIEVAMSALAAMRETLSQSGVAVQKKLSASAIISGNAEHLKVVLEELIRNAVTAMRDSPKKELEIFDEQAGGMIRLSVQDKGTGLSPEQLGRIFEPFYTTKNDGDTAGLGLSMALGIVKQFGGQLTAESTHGQGARFILEFPLLSATERLRGKSDAPKVELPVSSEKTNPKIGERTNSKIKVPTLEFKAPAETPVRQTMILAGEDEPKSPAAPAPTAPSRPSQPYESKTVEELAGHKPITGTKAMDLPRAPGRDEMTLIGIDANALNAEQEEWVMGQDPDEALKSVDAPASGAPASVPPSPKLRSGPEDLPVTIRRPNVKK